MARSIRPMEWLNYHHLRYFWTVAREGSIARASTVLHLSPPAISTQIRTLEEALGDPLFARVGRRLQLTERGRLVLRYADEIFNLGRELLDTLRDRPTGRPLRLQVGITDGVPRQAAQRLLEAGLRAAGPLHLVCRTDRPERLLAELAVFGLDLVISDTPLSAVGRVKAYHHPLGESELAIFGTAKLVRPARSGFPASLTGMPLLLPAADTAMRRNAEAWFQRQDVQPLVVGEFDDGTLARAFARTGMGLLVAPDALAAELRARHRLQRLGVLTGTAERLHAVTLERRVKHPAVLAMLATAAARPDRASARRRR